MTRILLAATPKSTPDPVPQRPWNAAKPTPTETYDGSGGTIHPSVVDMGPSGWRGYRYWRADTPYAEIPGLPGVGDNQVENPCIWASQTPDAWEVPPGVINPLVSAPGVGIGFHSDVELVHDPEVDRMVLFYRLRLANGGSPSVHMCALTSTDGVTWVDHGEVVGGEVDPEHVSPTVVREGPGAWRMWLWRAGSTGYVTVVTRTAASPLGPWSSAVETTLNGGPMKGWHGDVYLHEGRYYAAYSALDPSEVRRFVVATSIDAIHWVTPANPVIMERRLDAWDRSLYRPTLHPDPQPGVMAMWYSAISPTSPGGFAVGYTRIPLTAWTD